MEMRAVGVIQQASRSRKRHLRTDVLREVSEIADLDKAVSVSDEGICNVRSSQLKTESHGGRIKASQ